MLVHSLVDKNMKRKFSHFLNIKFFLTTAIRNNSENFFTVSESRSNVSKQMIIGGILMLSYYTPNIFYLII